MPTPKEFAQALAGLPANDQASQQARTLWVNWLSEYNTPGFYGRKGTGYDARFAYTHIHSATALLWLAEAVGIEDHILASARDEANGKRSLQGKAAAVRRHVPWEVVHALLWPGRTGA